MIKLKTLIPEHVVKKQHLLEKSDIVYKNSTEAEDEKASSAPDEFLIWINYYPLLNKAAKFNAKLTDVRTYLPKDDVQDKEDSGFFKKLGKSFLKAISGANKPGIDFEFTAPRFEGVASMGVDYKDGKFTLGKVRGFSGSSDEVPGYLTDEAVDKFIKYLLTRSEYADALKQAFPDIETTLKPDAFKK